jgi:hypothetical protein
LNDSTSISAWFKKLRAWLISSQEKSEPEISLEELPVEITESLSRATQALPSPANHREAVQNALSQALETWQEDDEAENSLVVLGSPAEDVTRVLDEVLKANQIPSEMSVRRLPAARVTDSETIATKLAVVAENASELTPDKQELVVVPSLSRYFLRCIGGLDGIVYLRDRIAQQRSRFWLIGCNRWAWQYLDCVGQIQAYFEQTVSIPALGGGEIKEWLQSLRNETGLDFTEKMPEAERAYFKRLAESSLGVAEVAARLWLRSLSYQPDNKHIVPEKVSFPNFRDLSASDRYLLYSLLLHGPINLPNLATSLGETESEIHPPLRRLRQVGLIEGNSSSLQVNPLHYPRLRSELKQNNFLVPGEN